MGLLPSRAGFSRNRGRQPPGALEGPQIPQHPPRVRRELLVRHAGRRNRVSRTSLPASPLVTTRRGTDFHAWCWDDGVVQDPEPVGSRTGWSRARGRLRDPCAVAGPLERRAEAEAHLGGFPEPTRRRRPRARVARCRRSRSALPSWACSCACIASRKGGRGIRRLCFLGHRTAPSGGGGGRGRHRPRRRRRRRLREPVAAASAPSPWCSASGGRTQASRRALRVLGSSRTSKETFWPSRRVSMPERPRRRRARTRPRSHRRAG